MPDKSTKNTIIAASEMAILKDEPLYNISSFQDYKENHKTYLQNKLEICFELEKQAEDLSAQIVKADGALTMAVYGAWGSGKTSLINAVAFNLWEMNNVGNPQVRNIVVKFNAWMYENEKNILIPLIGQIVKEVSAQSTSKKIKDLLGALALTAYSLAGDFKVNLPILGETGVTKFISEFIAKYKLKNGDSFLEQSTHYGCHDQLKKVTDSIKGYRICVVVDDLDRCMPDKAVDLLEGIKSILSHKNLVFLIGLNKSILNRYIKKTYREKFALENFSVDRYLDKLIQISYEIEKPDSEVFESFIDKKMAAIVKKYPALNDEQVLGNLKLASIVNPRSLIRRINDLMSPETNISEITSPGELKKIAFETCLKGLSRELFRELYCQNLSCDYLLSLLKPESQTGRIEDFVSLFEKGDKMIALAKLLESETSRIWLEGQSKRKKSKDLFADFVAEDFSGSVLLHMEKVQTSAGKLRLSGVVSFYMESLKYLEDPSKHPMKGSNQDLTLQGANRANGFQLTAMEAILRLRDVLKQINQLPFFSGNEDFFLILVREITTSLLGLGRELRKDLIDIRLPNGPDLSSKSIVSTLRQLIRNATEELLVLCKHLKTSLWEKENFILYTRVVLLESVILDYCEAKALVKFLSNEFDILKLTNITSSTVFASLLINLTGSELERGHFTDAESHLKILKKLIFDVKELYPLLPEFERLNSILTSYKNNSVSSISLDDMQDHEPN